MDKQESLAGTEPVVTRGTEGTMCATNIFSISIFPYEYNEYFFTIWVFR